jgi:hypothetical protein
MYIGIGESWKNSEFVEKTVQIDWIWIWSGLDTIVAFLQRLYILVWGESTILSEDRPESEIRAKGNIVLRIFNEMPILFLIHPSPLDPPPIILGTLPSYAYTYLTYIGTYVYYINRLCPSLFWSSNSNYMYVCILLEWGIKIESLLHT